jgi:protein translocase SecG subunit
MDIAIAVIALLAGVALIVAEALQPAKSDGFSVITGMASSRFQPGTKEFLMEKVARYSAVVWMISCAAYSYTWYKSHH